MRPRHDAIVLGCCAALALGSSAASAQQPATAPTAPPASGGALGAVRGTIYDSLARGPLAGAIVQSVRAGDSAGALSGGRSVAADSAGVFRIDSLAPGRYLVGFFHPLLDRLGVEAAPRLVDLGLGGDVVRVDLGVPDIARVRPVVCGSTQAPSDSSGLLVGLVRDAADGAPIANATVVLTWSERSLGARGVRTEHRHVRATTGPGGRYIVCGVPSGEELVATAAVPGRASGEVLLEVPPRGLAMRDLTLADTASVAAAPGGAALPTIGDTASASVARGSARLTGTVRDSAGRPVSGAHALVWGTAAATSVGADGAFLLSGLPAGTRTLEVRAIGFAPRRVPVDLTANGAASVNVRLDRVTNLDPVKVLGRPSRMSPLIRDFLDRRRHNTHGRFLTAADFARRKPTFITDALRSVPGIQIVSDFRLGGATIVGRQRQGGACAAVMFLNGVMLPPGQRIDQWVYPDRVAGVEVYANAIYAPAEYGRNETSGCSVVLIWTK